MYFTLDPLGIRPIC